MEETKVEHLATRYKLSIGNYYIFAVINKDGRISLSHNTNKYDHNKEFIFESSRPDMVYTIGTLIRDAADLVNTHE